MDESEHQLWIESLFLFAMVWSVGATGDREGRTAFDVFFRQVAAGQVPPGMEDYLPADRPRLLAPIMPADNTVYDYTFDKKSGKWILWSSTLGEVSPSGSSFIPLFSDLSLSLLKVSMVIDSSQMSSVDG